MRADVPEWRMYMSTKRIREIVGRACRHRWEGATEALSEVEAIETAAATIVDVLSKAPNAHEEEPMTDALRTLEEVARGAAQ